MPESEPKPKLIELVGSGAGQGWKAVLKSGKPAVVHEIPIPQAEAAAAVPRLQRLFDHRHPALSPVLAWGTDQQGVWVAVEPNEGTSLGSILSRGPLTPPAAAALGTAVLSGVAALHEAGIAMGGFGATAIRVTSNGEVRLAGHPAAAVRGAPSQSDLRADVRSGGMAVCAAFGVDPAGAPAPPNIPPGLVVTMRSMASGAMGPSADRAQGALREMAAPLLAPDRQVAAQSELATRAGGREIPAITPFLPAGEAPPPHPSAPVPAPYIAPPRREDTPIRAPVSYDAPDRPLQTYPSLPAVTFPPAPAPPPAPAAPVAPATSTPAVPTWSEAPAARATNPPAPAPVEPPKPAEPEPPRPIPSWETAAPAAPAATPFSTSPPAPASPFSTFPPAPSAPTPPAPTPAPPAPAPPPAQQTWSTVDVPVWKPGGTIPAEPLGFGTPVSEAPRATPPPPPAPAPVQTPGPVPARRPTVPRPPSRGAGLLDDRPPWLVPAAVAVVIVVLLGIFGVIVLAKRNNGGPTGQVHTTPSPHASGSPKGSPNASPSTKTPLAVPNFGAASADPITKVQFCTTATPCKIAVGVPDESATACELNSCTIEVALYFTSGQHVPVKYDLKFFDRCTGTTTDLPGPPAYTPPGYAVVIPRDHWAVSIPAGVKSGALVAVASQPSVAASAPLLLGGDGC